MSKLTDFYNNLDEYIIRNQMLSISIDMIHEDMPTAKIKMINQFINGIFYISCDGNEDGNELWLSFDKGNEINYYPPILFYTTIDMRDFLLMANRLANSMPKLNKFEQSFIIEFSDYKDINEIIGILTWWRDTNKGSHISCYVDTNSDDSCYMDCGAYTIESDEAYNARLALENEKADARLTELDRTKERELILDDIKRFEEQIAKFRERLESL